MGMAVDLGGTGVRSFPYRRCRHSGNTTAPVFEICLLKTDHCGKQCSVLLARVIQYGCCIQLARSSSSMLWHGQSCRAVGGLTMRCFAACLAAGRFNGVVAAEHGLLFHTLPCVICSYTFYPKLWVAHLRDNIVSGRQAVTPKLVWALIIAHHTMTRAS